VACHGRRQQAGWRVAEAVYRRTMSKQSGGLDAVSVCQCGALALPSLMDLKKSAKTSARMAIM